MIRVHITPYGFTVEGHADYAECGSDIVCAAVSALVDSTVMALADKIYKYTIVKGKVWVKYYPPDEKQKNNEISLITLPMRLGLAEIARQYPDRMELIEK